MWQMFTGIPFACNFMVLCINVCICYSFAMYFLEQYLYLSILRCYVDHIKAFCVDVSDAW